jgi:2'-5' RNA ligase
MSSGRYFFALWPDQRVREALYALSKSLPTRGSQHNPLDLHMTLVFLGQVEERQLACIADAADSISAGTFSLQLDITGYWPRPKILWAGPKALPEPLSQLVSDLNKNLTACGFEPERRKYKPHVTLYRKAAKLDPAPIESPISWHAQDFVLAVSEGGQTGARYRVVQRWPLIAPLQDNSEIG